MGDASGCATRYQIFRHCFVGEQTVADTHRLGCDGIGEVLATLGAIDVSSVFDHGKSVADA